MKQAGNEMNIACKRKGVVAVIVPPVVCHHLDPHTGIPFMPHMAGYLAGALDAFGYEVQAIDCFGLQPHNRQLVGDFMLLGVDEQWVADALEDDVEVAFIYCRTMAEFMAVERLTKALKQSRPSLKVCFFENIQAVTSFSLRHVADELMAMGCDAFMTGEPERRADDMVRALLGEKDLQSIPGVAFLKDGKVVITDDEPFDYKLDELPFPLWEKFPLEGYWIARFAHGPCEEDRFLPLLTSRGCPFRCTFCVSPEVNPSWRGRSGRDVVDEMEYFYRNMGVKEFHVSDLDPTVKDRRTQDICKEIIRRKLPVKWKLAQGTKIETIKSVETLELMAEAGCNFIAFSPETGSSRLLEIMNKPFDHDHALKMAAKISELGISSQACFVAGVPGENEDDRKISLDYVRKLVKAGVSEIAVYIFTPIPGAKLSDVLDGYENYSQCTHSPTWRKDYNEIQNYRMRMYRVYFSSLFLRPGRVLSAIKGFLTRRYKTKMEMSLYKLIKLYGLYYMPWLFKRLNVKKMAQQCFRTEASEYRKDVRPLWVEANENPK